MEVCDIDIAISLFYLYLLGKVLSKNSIVINAFLVFLSDSCFFTKVMIDVLTVDADNDFILCIGDTVANLLGLASYQVIFRYLWQGSVIIVFQIPIYAKESLRSSVLMEKESLRDLDVTEIIVGGDEPISLLSEGKISVLTLSS